MDVEKAIKIRRSIRRYKDTSIPDELIKKILESGRLAPSACNAQPWRYFVVRSEKIKKELKKRKAFSQDFVYDAPVLIVCAGESGVYEDKMGADYQLKDGTIPKDIKTREKWFKFLKGKEEARTIRDVAIASSFIVLRTIELGLGTCYIGLINEKVIKEVLGIKDKLLIPFVICLGYSNENPAIRPRKALKDIILDIK